MTTSRSTTKWFAEMQSVMKNRAVANPKHVVDSATFEPATPPSTSESPRSDGLEETPGTNSTDVSVLTDAVDDGCSEAQTETGIETSENNRPPSTSKNSKLPPTVENEGLPPKKKVTKIDRAGKASNDIIDRILKAQTEERKQAADMERERRKWELRGKGTEGNRTGGCFPGSLWPTDSQNRFAATATILATTAISCSTAANVWSTV